MDPDPPVDLSPQPSIFRWIIGFLLVGAAWGMTTPFMRRAAVKKDEEQVQRPERAFLKDPKTSFVKRKFWGLVYAVVDLLRRPAYAIPLVINLTGSVWFFLLIGQAGMKWPFATMIQWSTCANLCLQRSVSWYQSRIRWRFSLLS